MLVGGGCSPQPAALRGHVSLGTHNPTKQKGASFCRGAVEVGSLAVAGPFNHSFQFACVKGHTCTLEIKGAGLATGDELTLHEAACGGSSAGSTVRANLSCADGCNASFGAAELRAARPGPQALLAYWCRGCAVGVAAGVRKKGQNGFPQEHEFKGLCFHKNENEALALAGPDGAQRLECTLGRACALEVDGHALLPGDELLLLASSCLDAGGPLPHARIPP